MISKLSLRMTWGGGVRSTSDDLRGELLNVNWKGSLLEVPIEDGTEDSMQTLIVEIS